MKQISTDDFDERIYDDEETALVFFHRDGCTVCSSLERYLLDIEDDYTGVAFYAVSAEDSMELFERFSLMGVPQTLLFARGALVQRLSGRKRDDDYEQALGALASAGR